MKFAYYFSSIYLGIDMGKQYQGRQQKMSEKLPCINPPLLSHEN